MSVRSVRDISIQGLEKRKFPNKHYVYVIQVTWTTGATNKIYRRYSQFFEFQLSLIAQFPVQGGKKNPEDRVIPFLPGKILFGRSHVRGVAEQRLGPLTEYLEKLIALPSIISTSSIVSNFFEPTDEDIKPIREKQRSIRETEAQNISDPILLEQWIAIGDFNKEKRSECSLKEGDLVDVVEKKASGWWFVENAGNQGWVPASYLESVGGGHDDEVEKCASGEEEEYITNNCYIAQSADELSFERGVIVLVIQKNYDGWWLCKYQRKEGLIPAAYLETNTQEIDRTGERNRISTLPTCTSLSLADVKNDKFIKSAKSYNSVDIGQIAPKVPSGLTNAVTTNQFIPRRHSIKQVSIRKRKERESLGVPDKRIPEHKIDEFIATGDYETQDTDGLSFREGDVIEIVEKHDTGWWWANLRGELGWVPSTYLEKKDVQKYAKEPSPQMKARRNTLLEMKPKRCTSNGAFKGQTKDILSFRAGESFDIIEKSETGWWYVKNASGQEGWAPDNLLVEGDNLKPTRPAPASPTKPSQINSKFPKDAPEPVKPFLPVTKTFNGDLKSQLKPVTPNKPALVDKPVIQNKLPTKPTVIEKPDKPVLQARHDPNKPVLQPRHDTVTKPNKPVVPIQPKHTETSHNYKPIKIGSIDKPAMPSKASYAKVKINPSGASGVETNKPTPPSKPRHTFHESQSAGNIAQSELSGMIAKRFQTQHVAPNKPVKPSRPVSQDISGLKPVLPTHKKQSEPVKPVLPSRPSPTIATQVCNNYVTTDDNRAYDEGCLSFRKGESAELIEKGADGWCWMRIRKDEGWVSDSKVKLQSNKPGANLSSKKAGPVAMEDFKAEHEGSISIKTGDSIQVIEKDSGSGWTWVRAGKEEGWVPTDIISSC